MDKLVVKIIMDSHNQRQSWLIAIKLGIKFPGINLMWKNGQVSMTDICDDVYIGWQKRG